MPLFEQYVTIACVSNEVGGRPRRQRPLDRACDLARRARHGRRRSPGRPRSWGARWTASRSGFPTAWAMDAEPGADDRRRHERRAAAGRPRLPRPPHRARAVRLCRATKWLTEIELTTCEAFDGYWVPLGWAKDGPILTQSRIDVPSGGAGPGGGRRGRWGCLGAGPRGQRGPAPGDRVPGRRRQPPISNATWVQRTALAATPGQHRLEVEAIDGTGDVQTSQVTSPAPDGARGHHRITITVS